MALKIDLHIHSNASDGKFTPDQIFHEAETRKLDLISITDHDSIASQPRAVQLAEKSSFKYLVGIELNVTFAHECYRAGKEIYLDFVGYNFDLEDRELIDKLEQLRQFREERARKIIQKLNVEFDKEGIDAFTDKDLSAIKKTVDGAFGRPHIADYLVKQKIVSDRQEAFDRYLQKCYVPKFPLKLSEASELIHNAGGILVFAHGNDPSGTSLIKYTNDLAQQCGIIEEHFLPHIDGLEVWHGRHDEDTITIYYKFAKKHGLIVTGGTDCHQKPVRMGTVNMPDYVAEQFSIK